MSKLLILLLAVYVFPFMGFGQLWTQKADFGGVGRHRSLGISIGNKGYIGTGHVNGTGVNISYKDWWQYDPSSNSWTQKADYPVLNYGAVGWGTATRGYVGGGVAYTSEMHEYNPSTNTWSPIANCPFNLGEIQAFAVQNKGYVFGFTNGFAEYDPLSDSWTAKANSPISPSTWACSFGNSSSGFLKSGNQFFEYKPLNDTWIPRAAFPGLSTNGSAAFSVQEKGYVTCGYVGGLSVVTDEVWEFDPATNSWSFLTYFPGTNRRFPAAFAIGDYGYFGTGTNGINLNDFWQLSFPEPLHADQLFLSNENVRIYPIPATNYVNISIKTNEVKQLFESDFLLYNLEGKVLRKERIVDNNIEVMRNEWMSGLYYFSIVHSNKVLYSGKLIFN